MSTDISESLTTFLQELTGAMGVPMTAVVTQSGGVYRLDADWHPVAAGDAIWIAAYCPQWFIAAGPGPARYIYYKDVNRLPA